MYFDAVFQIKGNVLVFNGSEEETRNYFKDKNLDMRERLYVIPGKSLKRMTVQAYLEMKD